MSLRRASLLLVVLALSILPAKALQAADTSVIAGPVHTCIPEALRCGETRRAPLDATECFVDEEAYADFYTFAGPAGQTVTITMTNVFGNFTPSLFLFNPQPALVVEQDGTGSTATIQHTLERSGEWRIAATTAEAGRTGGYEITVQCALPPLPSGPFLTTEELPGFRFKVRITGGSSSGINGIKVNDCPPETLCVSGAVQNRAEVFVRIIGPRPNGLLWPNIIKFTTSQVEVWIQQISTGEVKYYLLPGANPTSTELPGLFDRNGFEP
ncbi:MAG TPA: PPC domain-containing protein [Thermoanaerobaculia bacterium]